MVPSVSSCAPAASESGSKSSPAQHLALLVRLLPCYPCPHRSACCSRGVSVTYQEAAAIITEFGADYLVWDIEEQGYRTRVEGQKCIFHKGGGCTIHDRTAYPKLCHNYPWFGMEGQVYEFEVDICPEMLARPELSAFLDDTGKHLRPSAFRLALEKMAHQG